MDCRALRIRLCRLVLGFIWDLGCGIFGGRLLLFGGVSCGCLGSISVSIFMLGFSRLLCQGFCAGTIAYSLERFADTFLDLLYMSEIEFGP